MRVHAVLLVALLFLFAVFAVSGASDKSSDTVKVIVYFKNPPSEPSVSASSTQPFSTLSRNAVSRSALSVSAVAAISSVSDLEEVRAVSAVSNGSIRVINELSAFNGFVGEVSSAEYAALKSNPNLKVYPDEEYHIQLDGSVPLVNASRSWALVYNGTNMTGNGEAVCVLDTGINYSHPALGGCTAAQFTSGTCAKVPSGWDYINNDNNPYDDHGHGSHVAGIIASTDSTYRGVAPNATIIAIKVCNSAGSCSSTAITSGLNWCVNNATRFNISVISMSIGSGNVYTDYCDADFTVAYATPIDTATVNNISVVIAAGNSGSTTGISAPACIKNATAVASTTKGDAFSSFSNRNSITDLAAPGSSITSVDYDSGGFVSLSGTSMATPHVAGAYALLHQGMRFEKNILANQSFLLDAFNSTGVRLTDSGGSGLTFSRISVYDAITGVDYSIPNLTFVAPTPLNASFASNNSGVYINITSSESLFTSFLEWSNGSVKNYSLSGSGVQWSLNFSVVQLGNVTFRVFGNDTGGNVGVTDVRYVRFNNSPPSILTLFPSGMTVNIAEPVNQTFNVSYSDSEGDLVNVSWLQNGSVVSYNTVNFTFLGNYSVGNRSMNATFNITVQLSDGFNTTFFNWTLNINNTNRAPQWNVTPANYSVAENVNLSFNVSGFDVDGDAVSYHINNTANFTINSSNGNISLVVLDKFFGVVWLNVSVSDGLVNTTEVFFVNVTLSRTDFDSDGIPDEDDADDDNDGVPDAVDSLVGNATTLVRGSALNSINVSVNGTANYSRKLSILAFVNVSNGSRSVVSFFWNFSASNLSLNSSLEVENASSVGGYTIVRGFVIPSGFTKNVTLRNFNDSVNSVCVRDSDVSSVGDISAGCDGASETLVECPGSSGSYSCRVVDNGSLYLVSGLSFSGVVERCSDNDGDGYGAGCALGSDCNDNDGGQTTSCSSVSASGSSGGGGGGGGGGSTLPSETSGAITVKGSGTVDVSFKKSADLAVKEIEVSTAAASSISNGRVTVRETTVDEGVSSSIATGSVKVYKYLSITKQNIKDSDVAKAKVAFEVPLSWFTRSNIDADTVKLNRYVSSQWVVLPTRRISTTSSSHVYEAETPGFSIFAISGEKIAETLEPLKPSLPVAVSNQSLGSQSLANGSFVSPVPSQPAQSVFSEPAAASSSPLKSFAVFGFALAIALAWFLRGSKRVSGRRVKGKSL